MIEIDRLKKQGVKFSHDDGIDCSNDVPLTQQSCKDECDINLIMKRALATAQFPVGNLREPVFADFTVLPTDLREAMNTVVQANNAFMSLEAEVRKKFDNDPVKLMEFLNDPQNREEAVKLGLVKAPDPVKVDPVVEAIKALPDAITASGAKKAKAKAADE